MSSILAVIELSISIAKLIIVYTAIALVLYSLVFKEMTITTQFFYDRTLSYSNRRKAYLTAKKISGIYKPFLRNINLSESGNSIFIEAEFEKTRFSK